MVQPDQYICFAGCVCVWGGSQVAVMAVMAVMQQSSVYVLQYGLTVT